MKARHIYYGLGALVLSGQPLFSWTIYQLQRNNSVIPPFRDWLFSRSGLLAFSFWVTVFSTAYVISRLTSTRAVRIAGLVAMPLGTIAIFSSLIRLVPQSLLEIRAVAYGIPFLMHPVFAAVLCGLVALATRATQATPGEAAEGLQRQRRVAQ